MILSYIILGIIGICIIDYADERNGFKNTDPFWLMLALGLVGGWFVFAFSLWVAFVETKEFLKEKYDE